MYLNEPKVKNIKLLGAFIQCPFGESVSECPFRQYHNLNDPDKQIEELNQTSQVKQKELSIHHYRCINLRSYNMRDQVD